MLPTVCSGFNTAPAAEDTWQQHVVLTEKGTVLAIRDGVGAENYPSRPFTECPGCKRPFEVEHGKILFHHEPMP